MNRTLYYRDDYKDFCNTYTVYAVAPADRERFERAFLEARRITRGEAIRLGRTRPRQAKADGEYWPAGFASRDDGRSVADPRVPTVAEALEDCRIATSAAMDRVEYEREGAAEAMAC